MWTHRIAFACLMLVACFRDPNHDDYDDHADAPAHSTAGRPATAAPSGDFCQQWATAACSDAVVSACQASDAAECRQTQAGFCHMLAPSDLSSSAREACIGAVSAAYRDADLRGDELATVLRFGGPCARLIVGSSKSGDSCSEASECELARGYACVKHADSNDGTCQIPQVTEPGRDCQAAQKTCGEGFFCDGHNCIETLKAGETCAIEEQCGADGFCNDKHACEARHKVNDNCQNDVECAHGICAEFGGQQVCTDRIVLSRADPVCANLR